MVWYNSHSSTVVLGYYLFCYLFCFATLSTTFLMLFFFYLLLIRTFALLSHIICHNIFHLLIFLNYLLVFFCFIDFFTTFYTNTTSIKSSSCHRHPVDCVCLLYPWYPCWWLVDLLIRKSVCSSPMPDSGPT